MLSKARGTIVALIIGSVIGGTAGVTIINAASASQSNHERSETAQVQTHESSAVQASTGVIASRSY